MSHGMTEHIDTIARAVVSQLLLYGSASANGRHFTHERDDWRHTIRENHADGTSTAVLTGNLDTMYREGPAIARAALQAKPR